MSDPDLPLTILESDVAADGRVAALAHDTYADDGAPSGGATGSLRTPGGRLAQRVEAIADVDALGRPVAMLGRVGGLIESRPPLRRALQGSTAVGHALHPALTDLPIGFWTSAFVLDLVGGRHARPAARRLVGLGIVAALPTAATGIADWLEGDRDEQRIGVAHALANTTGLALSTMSWGARRKGHHLRGVLLGTLAMGVLNAGAYLGGHLVNVHGMPHRDHRDPRTTEPGA